MPGTIALVRRKKDSHVTEIRGRLKVHTCRQSRQHIYVEIDKEVAIHVLLPNMLPILTSTKLVHNPLITCKKWSPSGCESASTCACMHIWEI